MDFFIKLIFTNIVKLMIFPFRANWLFQLTESKVEISLMSNLIFGLDISKITR